MQILKRLRQTLGLTQAELAEEMDVSRVSLICWETNRTTPHMKQLEKWLNALSHEILKLRANEKRSGKRQLYGAVRRSRMTKEELRKYGIG